MSTWNRTAASARCSSLYPQGKLLTLFLFYRWQELPQVSLLSQQKFCCDKDVFVVTKYVFFTTKLCLLWQNIFLYEYACRNKMSWQAYFCCDKKWVLSWQTSICCHKCLSFTDCKETTSTCIYLALTDMINHPPDDTQSEHIKLNHFICKAIFKGTQLVYGVAIRKKIQWRETLTHLGVEVCQVSVKIPHIQGWLPQTIFGLPAGAWCKKDSIPDSWSPQKVTGDHRQDNNNNNNVHLSCSHQHPQCSHDTY